MRFLLEQLCRRERRVTAVRKFGKDGPGICPICGDTDDDPGLEVSVDDFGVRCIGRRCAMPMERNPRYRVPCPDGLMVAATVSGTDRALRINRCTPHEHTLLLLQVAAVASAILRCFYF